MKRVLAGAAAGVGLFLLMAQHPGTVHSQSRNPLPVPVTASAGRWQVVNGTPEMTRNIMLLDTATGDTWVVCTLEGGTQGWCFMPRTTAPSVPSTKP